MPVFDVWHKLVLLVLATLLILQLCVKGEIKQFGYGQIDIYPADNQLAYYSLPTAPGWLSTHWYAIFVIVLLIVICIVSTIPSFIIWNRRVKQRKAREEEARNFTRVGSLTSSFIRQSFRSNTQHTNNSAI